MSWRVGTAEVFDKLNHIFQQSDSLTQSCHVSISITSNRFVKFYMTERERVSRKQEWEDTQHEQRAREEERRADMYEERRDSR